MTKRKLNKAVDKLNLAKKNREYFIPGILGFPIDGQELVEVRNRPGYVYVRLRNNTSEVIQAYNENVSAIYNLPVLVDRDETDQSRYKIVNRDIGQYQVWGTTPFLPAHGNQHSFNPAGGGGGDMVWVYGEQFLPLLSSPSGSAGSAQVVIHGYTYYTGSDWRIIGATGSASLLSYNPTGSNARMVLIYMDQYGNPALEGGDTYFDASITGKAQVLSYIPSPPSGTCAFVSGAARLVSGTSTILWGNLYDLREYYKSLI